MISSVTAVQNCAEPAQRPGSRSPPPQPDCLSPEPEEEDVGHCIFSASPVSSPVIQHRQPYISTHSRRSYTSPAAVHTHAAGDFRFSPCEDVDSNSSVTDSFPSFSASLSSSRGNTMIYYPHHGFSEVSLLEGKRERERRGTVLGTVTRSHTPVEDLCARPVTAHREKERERVHYRETHTHSGHCLPLIHFSCRSTGRSSS